MNKNKGFTLIELLVVVLIIGILAAVALPQYQAAVEKARVARMLPLLKGILNAQEVYKMANGEETDDLDSLDISVDYVAKNRTDTGSMQYDFSDGSYVRLVLSPHVVASHFKAGYVIDYYGKPTTRGNVSGSGLCYPDTDGGLAERVCKSMGPLSSIKSSKGTNVYMFSY